MKSRQAKRRFTVRLDTLLAKMTSEVESREMDYRCISLNLAINEALKFYRDERATDCSIENDGDMLLVQWGPTPENWEIDALDESLFGFELTRQFIKPGFWEDAMFQLRFTYCYEMDEALKEITSRNKWCREPDRKSLAEFASFIKSSEAYAAVVKRTPVRVSLVFDCVD
jgi:hypothetical protein